MPRFIPAVPKNVDSKILKLFDEELNDEFVLIFEKYGNNKVIICHPEYNVFVMEIDPTRWDRENESLTSDAVDIPPEFEGANKFLWVPYPVKGVVAKKHYCVTSDYETAIIQLAWMIKETEDKPIGIHKINEIIEMVAPGSPDYKKDFVSSQQTKLRRDELSQIEIKNEDFAQKLNLELSSMFDFNSGSLTTQKNENYMQVVKEQKKSMDGDHPKIIFLQSLAENIIGEDEIYLSGVQIDISSVVNPRYFLPALLITAGEDWGVLVHNNKKGGFEVGLTTNNELLFGYSVSHIKASANIILSLAVSHKLLSCKMPVDGMEDKFEFNLDSIMYQFLSWAEKKGIASEEMEDIIFRVPLTIDK